MAKLFRVLNDPYLVAKFQKLCGIESPPTPSDSHSVSDNNGTSDKNSDGVGACHGKNGVVQHTYKDRSVITNGIGDKANPNIRSRNQKAQENGQTSKPETVSNGHGGFVESEHRIRDTLSAKLLYYIFHFGANLGNELFYITFYPFWFWNCDAYVGRRICVFWCLFMYLGQATKDIIRLPRPPSPPVFRLEKRYALEYGLPSTHTMVGAGFPFGILVLTCSRYEYPFMLGLVVASAWCVLVGLSRMYLGMHSVLDILAGFAYVLLLMPLVFPYLDTFDHFVLTSPYSPYVCVLLPLILCICYPTLDKWSTARGDTTVIMAVGGGLMLGAWVCCQYKLMEYATVSPPFQIQPLDATSLWRMAARLVIGVLILVVTRAIMKGISYSVICKLVGIDKHDAKATQRLIVELPYKFITYFIIALNSTVLCPYVFKLLSIQRDSFYFEL